MTDRAVILAGGAGTRLSPMTVAISKQLLPVYDKPMIYYPLSTVMLAGIRKVLVITTPTDRPFFERLLGDGSQWGIELDYAVQPRPEGVAQALVIARDFIDGHPSALILGDNLFYGHGLVEHLRVAVARREAATVFVHPVRDPGRYGVVGFDDEDRPVSIEEKPEKPRSRFALTGLYFFDARAPEIAASLAPSARGELEITDVVRWYLDRGALHVERLGRGLVWLDTGTAESLMQAANLVEAIEQRQGLKICCVEEVAYRMGYIDDEQLLKLADGHGTSPYGRYLEELVGKG